MQVRESNRVALVARKLLLFPAMSLGSGGVFVGLGGALLDSCLVIFSWHALSRPQV
jgi:hypothetical protein